MENPKSEAKIELGPAQRSLSEVGKGGLKSAVHGVFAKVQSKTGLEDKKIDEFQEKWLAIPENRTKYKHLVDAPTIVAEEMFALFNDIIDFVQAQEVTKSHIIQSLRAEALAIKKSPEIYLGEKMDYGKSLWQRGVDFAKGMIGKKIESKMPEDAEPEEEMSDFEKAESEDGEGAEPIGTQNFASKAEKPNKPVARPKKPKTKPATAKKKRS